MTAIAETIETQRADVGWIVGSTVDVLRARALDLLVIGLPFVWLPQLLMRLAPPDLAALRMMVPALSGMVFSGGASLIAYQRMTGGDRTSPAAAIGVGVRRFFTLFLIAMISSIITLVGLVLLVAPGIFVICAFMAATAVAVVEGKGSTAALERAWRLSQGSRARLAGLLGLAVLAYVVTFVVLMIVAMAVAIVAGTGAIRPVEDFAVAPLLDFVLLALTTVGATAAYVNLRTLKEGPIDLAGAFD